MAKWRLCYLPFRSTKSPHPCSEIPSPPSIVYLNVKRRTTYTRHPKFVVIPIARLRRCKHIGDFNERIGLYHRRRHHKRFTHGIGTPHGVCHFQTHPMRSWRIFPTNGIARCERVWLQSTSRHRSCDVVFLLKPPAPHTATTIFSGKAHQWRSRKIHRKISQRSRLNGHRYRIFFGQGATPPRVQIHFHVSNFPGGG